MLSDITLNYDKIKLFMDGTVLQSPSDFEISSVFAYSQNQLSKKIEVDCLLLPFLYSYHNMERKIPVILCDYPELMFRDQAAKSIKTHELRQLYTSFINEKEKGNKNFDPTLLRPDIFINPKI